jgi:hypothetical protein
MVVKSMRSYVADELANKIKFLTLALSQAKEIISKLEIENELLKIAYQDLENRHKQESLVAF